MVWNAIHYMATHPPWGPFVLIYCTLFTFTFKYYIRMFNHPSPLVRVFLLVLLPAAPYVVIYSALFRFSSNN